MVTMEIDSIRASLIYDQRVVILKEKDSQRFLPIWIGSPEADAIAGILEKVFVPRPLTHDLLHAAIEGLGGRVDHVVISSLRKDTFFAKVVIARDWEIVELNCRPSDAIAMGLRSRVPICVEGAVLDKAGIRGLS